MRSRISHALWQRRYGGDPGIVGKSLRHDKAQSTKCKAQRPKTKDQRPSFTRI